MVTSRFLDDVWREVHPAQGLVILLFSVLYLGCLSPVSNLEYICDAQLWKPPAFEDSYSPYLPLVWKGMMPVDIEAEIEVTDGAGNIIAGTTRYVHGVTTFTEVAQVTAHTGREHQVEYERYFDWYAVFKPDEPLQFNSLYRVRLNYDERCVLEGAEEQIRTHQPMVDQIYPSQIVNNPYMIRGNGAWNLPGPASEAWPEPSFYEFTSGLWDLSYVVTFSEFGGNLSATVTPLSHHATTNWPGEILGPYGQDTCLTTIHDIPVIIDGLNLTLLFGDGLYTGNGEPVLQRGKLDIAFLDQTDVANSYWLDLVMDLQAHPFWLDGTLNNSESGATSCLNSTRTLCTWAARTSFDYSIPAIEPTQYPIYQITQTQTENRWCLDQCTDGIDNDNDGMIDTDPECDAGW